MRRTFTGWNPARVLPLEPSEPEEGFSYRDLENWCIASIDAIENDYQENPCHQDWLTAQVSVYQGIYKALTGNKITYQTIETRIIEHDV